MSHTFTFLTKKLLKTNPFIHSTINITQMTILTARQALSLKKILLHPMKVMIKDLPGMALSNVIGF
jgi:hypothetical protein